MRKILILATLSIILTSCDSPRSQRSLLSTSKNASTVASNGVSFGNSGTVTETTTDVESDSTIPSDAKHCKFSKDGVNGFESTSTHLGSYTLCRSSTDKTVFYAQFKTPPVGSSGDVKVCFIPHTTPESTNRIYVGNPMCGSFPEPKAVKKITFIKYTAYSEALIDSVMFFKDTSYDYPVYNRVMMTLEAYKVCMNYLAVGNSTYCQAFKSAGNYVMKDF